MRFCQPRSIVLLVLSPSRQSYGTPSLAVIPAATMGLSSLISSFTIPLFKKLWNSSSEHFPQYLVRMAAVVVLTGYLVDKLWKFHIDILQTILVTAIFHRCVNGPNAVRNMNKAQIFISV